MQTQDRNRTKIAKAALYIEENLSGSLRAFDIANHANLSPFHFQRLFCAYMGEPVSQYIVVRRLEAAALELARNSSANILQVALDYGFQTHSAFSRAFGKQFGVSPSAFRNNPDAARKGVDQDRRFLISAPPSKTIEAVGIAELESFDFLYRQSSGTQEGQFFRHDDQNIALQFSSLLASPQPPDLFLMSCFPSTPQKLNDGDVPIWFGGAFSASAENNWSKEWHRFSAGSWAVFEHWGEYEFLYQTWNQIYRNWLPKSDHVLRDELPFEAYLYSGSERAGAAQLTHIYIPVKKA